MSSLALGSTRYMTFSTIDLAGELVAPSAAIEPADVAIYKDGSTKRANANGVTVSVLDGIAGKHVIAIDTSDDSDAGFWADGAAYHVALVTDKTVDGTAINGMAVPGGDFTIAEAVDSLTVNDLNTARDQIIDTGNNAWVTADGFATPTETTAIIDALAAFDVRAQLPEIANLDDTISSRLAAADYSAPDLVGLQTAIIAAGNSNWSTATGFATSAETTAILNAVNTIEVDESSIATAVRAAMPEISNLDASVSSAVGQIEATGDARWATATGFATLASTMAVLEAVSTLGTLAGQESLSSDIGGISDQINNLDVSGGGGASVGSIVDAITPIIATIATTTGSFDDFDGSTMSLQALRESGTPAAELVDLVQADLPTLADLITVRTDIVQIGNNNWSVDNAVIAQTVRAELPEISRLDATVSSRLESARYVVPPTTADIEAALINEGDGQQLVDAIVQVISSNLNSSDLELSAIAIAVRDAMPEINNLDATISSRATEVTTNTALAAITDQIDSLAFEGASTQQIMDAISPILASIATTSGSLDDFDSATMSLQALRDAGTPAAEFVGMIRTDLTPELDRIDQPISSVSVDLSGVDFDVDEAAIVNAVITALPINPVVSQVAKQVAPSTLAAFLRAEKRHTVIPLDANDGPINTKDIPLEVIIEAFEGGADMAFIEDADITKTASNFSFTVPATAHVQRGDFRWACRRTDSGDVIAHGPYVVEYAAAKDA